MLISKNWLQTYFKEPLPADQKIADTFTMGVFEIESVEQKNAAGGVDTVFDIKTLADRNPYALSHRYMALELGVLLRQEVVYPIYEEIAAQEVARTLEVSIEQPEFCKRYIGRVVEGVAAGPSPAWLKEKLEVLGQRSINTIVDLTNFVMLDTGQPLHAFDADKVKGNIKVRLAKEGEEIVLLDGTTVKLTSTIVVIADDEAPLAIAGVKGGKKAEVTADTKNIIIEAATFNGGAVRKTAQSVKITNDSTKRFENNVTPERALLAMTEISALIAKEMPGATFGALVDQYPEPATIKTLTIEMAKIHERLGMEVPKQDMLNILSWLQIEVKDTGDTLELTLPPYRTDLVITEDIAEEVGRIYGYDKVKGILPPPVESRKINKNFYYHNLIRKTLVDQGFSEVFTYTLQDEGDVELANPLNAFRGKMRNDLSRLLGEKLEHNVRYADLLGISEVKIFEIGKVFGGGYDKERFSLAFGIAYQKPPKGFDSANLLHETAQIVAEALGVSSVPIVLHANNTVAEIDLDPIIATLPEPTSDVEVPPLTPMSYKSFSIYPFSVRDIAVFVPGEQSEANKELVLQIIKSEARDLLVRSTLFDVFTKTDKETGEVKTSYAYRLVFQAPDRTLNEEDLNGTMIRITEKMNGNVGWQVR